MNSREPSNKEMRDNFLAREYGGYQDSILASVSTAASKDSFVYALTLTVNIDGERMRYILSAKSSFSKGDSDTGTPCFNLEYRLRTGKANDRTNNAMWCP